MGLDIGKLISSVAPWIGTALGGPLWGTAINAGMKAFGLTSSGDPDKDKETFQNAVASATPDQLLALKKADQDFALQMQALGYKDIEALNALAVQNAADINTTMQVEAKAEHWVTYAWRPAVGFAIALLVVILGSTISVAYIAAIFGGKPEALKALEYIPGMVTSIAEVLAMVSPIVGIASWFRGKKQVAEVATTDNAK